MASLQLNELVPMLQVAVGPVILISGAGLVLLSLTNRFARAVDRTRELIRQMRYRTNLNSAYTIAGQDAPLTGTGEDACPTAYVLLF